MKVSSSKNAARFTLPHKGLIIATVTVVGLLASACSSSSKSGGGGGQSGNSSKSSYNIVIVSDLTGAGAFLGVPAVSGFKSAIQSINDGGGVNGRKIDFTVIDDQSTPAGAASAGQQAVEKNPTAILDGSISSYFTDRLPIYSSAKIPVFATGGTSFYPWLYSTQQSPAQAASAVVGTANVALGKSVSGERVAVVGLTTPGGRAQISAESALLSKQGANVVKTTLVDVASPSFDAQAAQIVAAKPDVVTTVTSTAVTVLAAKALITAGYKGPITGSLVASDDASLKAINSSQYFAYRTTGPVDVNSDAYNAAKKVGVTSDANNTYFGWGWIIGSMLDQGLTKCGGSCNSSALLKSLDALGSVTVPGSITPYGNVTVSSTDHNVVRFMQVFKWDASAAKAVTSGSPVALGASDY
jgi:branched-chain amino acid transport system substrate-binding protein